MCITRTFLHWLTMFGNFDGTFVSRVFATRTALLFMQYTVTKTSESRKLNQSEYDIPLSTPATRTHRFCENDAHMEGAGRCAEKISYAMIHKYNSYNVLLTNGMFL